MTVNRKNGSILLREDKNFNGLQKVRCKINDKESLNTLTIPFISEPTLSAIPNSLTPNQTTVITCDYSWSPNTTGLTSVLFRLNKTVIAMLDGVQHQTLQHEHQFDGIRISESKLRNSIQIMPSKKNNVYGEYSCGVSFTFPRAKPFEVLSNNRWSQSKSIQNSASNQTNVSIILFHILFILSITHIWN